MREGRDGSNIMLHGELIRYSETVRNPKSFEQTEGSCRYSGLVFPWAPHPYSTHVLIQVIVLRHGEEDGEGGVVEDQQNISVGVYWALRKGLEYKMLGADSRRS